MKRLKHMTVALAALMTLIGCSPAAGEVEKEVEKETVTDTQTPTETPEEMPTIVIGMMGAIEGLPIIIADHNGYYEEAGVNVEIQVFKAAPDMNAAIQAGELDGILNDQVAISIFQNAGIDMKITGITDAKFTLVAGKDSNINSLEDLAGKKIGISENTVIDFTLDQLLAKASLTADDVEKVAIPAMPARLEMINTGQIDAALMPDPFANAAVAAGGHVVYEVTADKDTMVAITAFSQEAIDAKPEAIVAFYEAYNKAVDYINTTSIEEYEDLVIETVGYPQEMKGQLNVPTFRKNMLPPLDEIQITLDWATDRGILTKELTPEDVVNAIGVK